MVGRCVCMEVEWKSTVQELGFGALRYVCTVLRTWKCVMLLLYKIQPGVSSTRHHYMRWDKK